MCAVAFASPLSYQSQLTPRSIFSKQTKLNCRRPCIKSADHLSHSLTCNIQKPEPQPQKQFDKNHDEAVPDPKLSRRVFLTGTVAISAIVTLATYRELNGEELPTAIGRKLSEIAPNFFGRSSKMDSKPLLNSTFSKAYFEAIADSAISLGVVPSQETLLDEEAAIRKRALSVFFSKERLANDDIQQIADNLDEIDLETCFGNEDLFNFILYARLHSIAERTSPQSRLQIATLTAEKTLPLIWQVNGRTLSNRSQQTAKDPDSWLQAINTILGALQSRGWLSSYRVEFSDLDKTAWLTDGKTMLTVWVSHPVTMTAAQVIAGESFEELSPKVSPWLSVLLKRFGVNASAEDYYVDDTYRPNVADYRPSSIATQLNLSVVTSAS